jgi:hypothetical protein
MAEAECGLAISNLFFPSLELLDLLEPHLRESFDSEHFELFDPELLEPDLLEILDPKLFEPNRFAAPEPDPFELDRVELPEPDCLEFPETDLSELFEPELPESGLLDLSALEPAPEFLTTIKPGSEELSTDKFRIVAPV